MVLLNVFWMLFMTWWVVQNHIWWWLWVFALRLDEPGLQVDDVLAQRVVLRLDGLVIILQIVQISDLLLELLDISLLALSKGTLLNGRLRKLGFVVLMT